MNYYSIKPMTGGCAIVATSLDDADVFKAISRAIRGGFVLCNICEITDEVTENAIGFDDYIEYLRLKQDINDNVVLFNSHEEEILKQLQQ